MKKFIAAVFVALPLFAVGASAAAAADTPTAKPQSKLGACSKANKGLKGDEFKQAQKECMANTASPAKSAAVAEKPVSQKGKMAACSTANKGLKGDEYKNAQKACLSK